MNFIAADCAISLFPYATFTARTAVQVNHFGRYCHARALVDKYTDLGFNIVQSDVNRSTMSYGQRWIRDAIPDEERRYLQVVHVDGVVPIQGNLLLPLPVIPEPAEWHMFWDTRFYDLAQFRSAERRLGVAFWYRNGWTLFRDLEGLFIGYELLSYDGEHEYCVPYSFKKHVSARMRVTAALTAEEKGRR